MTRRFRENGKVACEILLAGAFAFLGAASQAFATGDVTAPSAVTSLTGILGSDLGKLRLTWTSPGDDALSGNLVAGSSYTIQYTTMAAFANWSPTAALPGHVFRVKLATSSVAPYSVRTYELTGLTLGGTYYIRIWISDDESNMSAISNGATSYAVGWFQLSAQGPAQNANLAMADYDNDGYPDAFTVTGSLGETRVYHNNKDGTFSLVWTAAEADNSPCIAAGDWDGDGYADFAVGNQGSSQRVYRNIGGGIFSSAWTSPITTDDTQGIAWGDYDNDGDLDLMAANFNAGSRLFRNNGGGSFSEVWTSPANQSKAVAWADYDNDGDLDVAMGNYGTGGFNNKIYRNDGNETFTLRWTAPNADNTAWVSWGDYDADGDMDLAVGTDGGANRVYKNNGSDTFNDVLVSDTDHQTNSIAWGDFDNDGKLDLLTGNNSNATGRRALNQVLRWNGTDSFSEVWNGVAPSNWRAAWADIDKDFDLDQVVADGSLILYKSNRIEAGLSPNSAPSAPSSGFGTVYIASATRLELRWGAGSDGLETPANGLNYDLRVSTYPLSDATTKYVVSPTTGAGTYPFMGNTQHSLVAPGQLGFNLSSGAINENCTYYWSVRTRDAQLKESGWSTPVQALQPGMPKNVSFFGVTGDSIAVTWSLIPGRSYTMLLSEQPDFSVLLASGTGSLNQNVTSYANLSENVAYYFKVKVSTLSENAYSPPAPAVTQSLGPPNVKFYAVASDSASLRWDSIGTNAYTMALSSSSDFSTAFSSGTGVSNQNTTSYFGLLSNTTYFFKVKVSTNADFYYSAIRSTYTYPSMPVSSITFVSTNSITLTVTKGLNTYGSYHIQISTDSGFGDSLLNASVFSSTANLTSAPTTYGSLLFGATYFVRTRVLWNGQSQGLEHNASGYVSLTTATLPVLPALSLSDVDVDNISVTVLRGGNNNPMPFEVSFSSTSNFFTNVTTATLPATSLGLNVSSAGLVLNTSYYIRARALWNSAGVHLLLNASGYTPVIHSTTLLTAIPAVISSPTNVNFYAIAPDSVSLRWDSFGPNNSYTMIVSSSSNFSTALSSGTGQVSQNATSYFGLLSNTTYFFKVKVSTNTDLYYTVPISTYTYPSLPVSSITFVSTNSITLTLTRGPNAYGSYNVQMSTDSAFGASLPNAFVFSSTANLTSAPTTYGNLLRGATYFVRTRMLWNGQQQGLEQNVSGYLSLSTCTRPVLPSFTLVSVMDNGFIANVTRGSNNSDLPYEVSYSTNSNFKLPVATAAVSMTPGSNAVFSGLLSYTTYFIRARALWNSAGTNLLLGASGYTAITTTRTLADPDVITLNDSPGVSKGTGDRTTSPFFAPANSVIVACVMADEGAATQTFTITDNTPGGPLTWTNRGGGPIGNTTNDARSQCWTAPTASPQNSMTVTVTLTDTAREAMLKTLVFTGADLSNPIGASGGDRGATTNLDVTYQSTVDNSLGLLSYNDWNVGAVPTVPFGETVIDSYSPAQVTAAMIKLDTTTTPIGLVHLKTNTPTSGLQVTYLYLEVLPARIQNLKNIGVTNSSASYTWSNVPGSRYIAAISSHSSFSFALSSGLTALNQNTSSFVNLAVNTSYFFKVKVSTKGDSEYLTLSTATTANAPKTSTVTAVDFSSFTMTWDPNGNPLNPPTSYQIQISTSSDFVIRSSSVTFASSLSAPGLLPNGTYFIRVQAFNRLGLSTPTTNGGFNATVSTCTLPVLPISSVTFVSSNSITLVVSSGSNAGGRYHLQISTDSAFGAALPNAAVVSATGTLSSNTTAFGGLLPGASYYTRVRTLWNGQQQGLEQNASGYVSLSTGTLPVLPSLSFVSVDLDSVTVLVNRGGNNNPMPFEVSFSSTSNFSSAVTTETLPATSLGLHVSSAGLVQNTNYFVRARALWNSAGTHLLLNASGHTPVLVATTLAPSVLISSPTNVSFYAVASDSVSLRWDAIGTNAYTMLISSSSDFSSAFSSGTGMASQNTTSYFSLFSNTTYYFKVKLSTNTDLFYSVPVSTYTYPSLAVSSITFVSTNSITLTIDKGLNTYGSYHIQISTDSGFGASLLNASVFSSTANLTAAPTTYGNLLFGATYFVRTRTLWNGSSLAHNASGYVSLTTATLPVLPTLSLAGVAVGSFTVTVGTGANNNSMPFEISYTTSSNFVTPVTTVTLAPTQLGVHQSFSSLTPNATYFIRARALWNSAGTNLLLNASGYTDILSTCTYPSISHSSITFVSTNSITMMISSGSNVSGRYHVQISTDAGFGASLLNASVFSSTGILSSDATTYGNLLFGATYFVRTRVLWNGQQQGLEQNASGYVSLSTATLPVLPTLTVFGTSASSFTVIAGRGNNNNNPPFEITFSTSSNFAAPVTTSTLGSSQIGLHQSFSGLTEFGTYYLRARALWNGAGGNLLLGASGYTAILSTGVPNATALILSVRSGNWSDGGTWVGGFAPVSGNKVRIEPAHVVTLDQNATVGDDISTTAVKIAGTLTWGAPTSSFTLTSRGSLEVLPGGSLLMGTAGSPIPADLSANLVLASSVTVNPYGLTIYDGAVLRAQGADKDVSTVLISPASGGNTVITVNAAGEIDTWKAGDSITVGKYTTNSTQETEKRTIESVSGNQITLTSGLTYAHGSSAPVANLTKSVVIRSSDSAFPAYILNLNQTAHANFQLKNVQMAYLGRQVTDKWGVTFSSGAVGTLDSSSIHEGYTGLFLQNSSSNSFTNNLIYSHTWVNGGIYSILSASNTFAGNHVYGILSGAGAVNGFTLSSSHRNALTSNHVYGILATASGQAGISLNNSSSNTLTSNQVYGNYGCTGCPGSGDGISLTSSFGNILTSNRAYLNLSRGFILQNSGNNKLVSNQAYSNGLGISVGGTKNVLLSNETYSNTAGGVLAGGINVAGANNILAANRSYSNTPSAAGGGIVISAANNALVGNYSYGNTGSGGYGIHLGANALNTAVVDCGLGFDANGNSSPNEDAQVFFTNSASANALFKNTKVHAAGDVDRTGLNRENNHLISYRHNQAAGLVHIWGDYQTYGSTLSLNYSEPLYVSTYTIPIIIRGLGHGATVLSTTDGVTKSELVTLRYQAADGKWHATGSASGALGSFTYSGSPMTWSPASGEFTLDFTEAPTPEEGDSVEFVTFAAAGDAGAQKRLLVGGARDAATAWNNGRSRIVISSTGALKAVGSPAFPTILDWIDSSSTYYTLISSGGRVHLEDFYIAHVDTEGFKFITNPATMTMKNGTFDYAMSAGSTGTFIQLSSVTTGAAWEGIQFKDSGATKSRPSNVRVNPGNTANLAWTFNNWGGERGGEDFDYDHDLRISWSPLSPPNPRFFAVASDSVSVTWDAFPGNFYTMVLSSASDFSVPVPGTGELDVNTTSYAGLLVNTTYFFKVKVSTHPDTAFSPVISTITFPALPVSSITVVSTHSITLVVSRGLNTYGSYHVQMSTDSGFGASQLNASVFSSTTALTSSPTTYGGLLFGATYFVRTRMLWNGQTQGFEHNASGYVLLTTATLPVLPSISLANVTTDSMTVVVVQGGNNNPMPFEVSFSSTSNFSSALTTVTLPATSLGVHVSSAGLSAGTSYYARARALWNSSGSNLLLNASGYTPVLVALTPIFGAPANVRYYAVASDSVSLRWDAVGANAYTMVISSSSDFSAPLSSGTAPPSQNTTSYFGLFSNTTCYFKVKVSTNTDLYYSVPISTFTHPSLAVSPITAASTNSITLTIDKGLNTYGSYHIQISTDSGFGASLLNASVFSSTANLTSAPTTYGGLLFGATYFVRTRTLWNGQIQNLEHNASGYVSLTTATLPVLPSLSLVSVAVDSVTVLAARGANNNPMPFEISFSSVSDFSSAVTTETLPATSLGLHVSSSGLLFSTSYYVRARALWNSAGVNLLLGASGYTPVIHSTTLALPVISSPTNVSFYAIAAGSVSLRWDAIGANAYTMLISSSSDFSTAFSSGTGMASQNTTSYFSLFSNTTCFFKVKVSTDTDLFYSVPISTYTYPSLAVSSITFVSTNSITLTIDKGLNTYGSYHIQISTDSGFGASLLNASVFSSTANLTAAPTTYGNLIFGATYFIRTRTLWNGSSLGHNASGYVSLTTATLPVLPSLALASITNNAILLDVNRGLNNNNFPFEISSSSNANFTGAVATTTYPSTQVGIQVSSGGLAGNATYYFRARALWNSAGGNLLLNASGYAPAVSSVTLPAVPSLTISGITTSTFTLVVNLGANLSGNYNLQISTDSNFGIRQVLSSTGPLSSNATSFGGLLSGTTYFIRARTLWNGPTQGSEHNASAYTSIATMTLPLTALNPAFTGVRPSSVTLTWTSIPGSSFNAVISTDNSFSVATSSALANSNTTTYMNLSSNATYYFKIKVSSETDASYSSIITTVTLPALPVSSITVVSTNSITVIISSGANLSGSYHVQISTDSNFGASLLNASVFSSTGTFSAAPTAYGSLLFGATYYVRARALWNGQSQGLEHNASGYVSLTTATLPVLPSLTVVSVEADSFTVTLDKGENNNDAPYELSFSTHSDFSAAVTTPPVGVLPSGNTSFASLGINTTYFIRARTLWNSAGSNLLLGASGYTLVSTATLPTAPVTAASTFTFVSAQSITAQWLSGGNPNGTLYIAEVSTWSGFAGAVTSSSTYATSVTTAGLPLGATYFFRVKAKGHGGYDTAYLDLTSTTTVRPPPATGITFFAVSHDSVSVNWNLQNNISYTMVLSAASDFSTVVSSGIGALSQNTTSYAGLIPNATYFFKVKVSTYPEESYNSPVSTFTFPVLAVSSITAVSANSITLTVLRGLNDYGSYHVQISTDSGFGASLPKAVVFSATNTLTGAPTTYGGLLVGATYFVRTRVLWNGQQDVLEQNASGYVSLSTATLPVLPTLSLISLDVDSVTVSVARGANNGNFPYEISISSTSNFAAIVTTRTLPSDSLGIHVSSSGLTANTTYFIRARALWNSAGTHLLLNASGYTDVRSTATLARIPLTAGSTFTYVGVSSITAQWLANGNAQGTLYTVDISTWNGFLGAVTSSLTFVTRVTTEGLTDQSTYFFRVKARNHNGLETAYLDLTSTRTLANSPASPPSAIEFFAVSQDSVSAHWGLLTGNSYTMALSTASDFSAAVSSGIGGLEQTTTSYAGLIPNATYFFRVKVSSHPDTSYSAGISTYTLPVLPVSSITVVSTNSITLTVLRGLNNSGSYHIQISTDSGFGASLPKAAVFSATNTLTGAPTTYGSLLFGATYFLRTRVLWNGQQDVLEQNASGYVSLSTATLPVLPSLSVLSLDVDSVTVSVARGANNNNFPYEISISSTSNFSANVTTRTLPSNSMGIHVSSSGLTANTTYFIRARALWNSAGTHLLLNASGYTDVRSTATLAKSPGIVSFSVYNTSASVVLAGNNNSMGTTISISTGAFGVRESSSGLLSSGNISLTLLGLTANTTYTLQARAVNFSNLPSSATLVASTATFANPPIFNSMAAADVRTTSMTLSWSPNLNALVPPTSYQIQISTDDTFMVYSASDTFLLSITTLTLTPNTSYHFRALAYHRTGGQTAYTNTVTTATLAAAPVSVASSFTITTTSITAHWMDPSNPAQTLYIADISTWNGFAGTVTSSQTFNLYVATSNIDPVGTFHFRVKARNRLGRDSEYLNIGFASLDLVSPNAISGLTAFVGSADGEAELQWASPGSDGPVNNLLPGSSFRVRASTSPIPNFNAPSPLSFAADISTSASPGSRHGYVVTGLNPGTTYYFAIITRDSGGNQSTWSNNGVNNFSSAPAKDLPPAAPTSASPPFSNVTESSVRLAWNALSAPSYTVDITSYLIYRATFSFSSSSQANVTFSTSIPHPFAFFVDTGLASGATYFYRVTAVDSGTVIPGLYSIPLEGGLSAAMSTATRFNAPAGFSAVIVSSQSIIWNWLDRSLSEAGFRVYSTTGGVVSGDLNPGTTTWTEYNLSPNTPYSRYAVAFNAFAESDHSITVSSYTAAIPPPKPDIHPNGTSTSLDFVIDPGANPISSPDTKFAVAISTDDFTGPATNYVRYPGGGITGSAFWQTSSLWASNVPTITGLLPDSTYYIKIKARNEDLLETSFSASSSAITLPQEFIPPANISDLVAVGGSLDGEINLSWTSPGDDQNLNSLNQAVYRIRFATSTFEYFSSTEACGVSNCVSFSTNGVLPGITVGRALTGFNPGTTYYFGVIVRDDNSNWSSWKKLKSFNLASSTPAPDFPLAPPVPYVSSVGEDQVMVSWALPSPPRDVDDRDAYQLFRATYSFSSATDPQVTLATTVVHPGTFYIDTGLSFNTYYYRLTALDKGDQGGGLFSLVLTSTFSVAVTTRTRVNPPTSFTAASISTSSVIWSWNDNSILENYYQISSTNGVIISSPLAPGSTYWVESGLLPNRAYGRKVDIVIVSSETLSSSGLNRTTLANAPKAQPYSNVLSISFTASWATQNNPIGTLYTFQLARDSSFTSPELTVSLSGTNQFSFSDLTPNSTYFVRVKAKNQENVDTVFTDLGSTVTRASTLPAPVLSNAATGTIQALIEPGENPVNTELSIGISVDGFLSQIFVQPNETLGAVESFQTKASWNGGTVTLRGLLPNVIYQVRTRARNSLGIVNQASDASTMNTLAQTPYGPLVTPEFDAILGNHVHISISPDANSASTQYSFQYLSGGLWLQGDGTAGAAQVWKTASQWTAGHAINSHGGLTGGTSYSYRMQARNSDGILTAFSSVTSVTVISMNDTVPPSIVSISPLEREVSALANSIIRITLTEEILAASVAGNLTLTGLKDNMGGSLSASIPGSVSVSSNVITFTPSSTLQKGYEYQVTASTGITDLAGNLVTAAKVWTFRTACDSAITNKVLSAGSFNIQFNPGVFSEDYGVAASNPQLAPREIDGLRLARAVSRGGGDGSMPTHMVPAAIVEINVYAAGGSSRMTVPKAPATLTMSYPDADDDGLVDGLSFPIRPEDLSIYFLDETSENFVKLPASRVDTAAKTVTVALPHFSVFALFGSPSTSLVNAHPYPVPFMPSQGDTRITFTDLSGVATIRIYTVSGELVQTLEESDGDGQYAWDVKSSAGNDLASGVYVYVIQNPSEEKRGKLVVVR